MLYNLPKGEIVFLTQAEADIVKDALKDLEAEKLKEDYYKRDSKDIAGRFETGWLGEMAVCKFLGLPAPDFTIGCSYDFNNPDLPNRTGVKTSVRDFHTVAKYNSYPQILVKKHSLLKYEIYGVVSAADLESKGNINLITNPDLKARGTKVGFNNYELCKPIKKD